jgi:hypothetical protein
MKTSASEASARGSCNRGEGFLGNHLQRDDEMRD